MKPKKDLRKPEKKIIPDSDDLKLSRKLKPVKKEKNVKRALFQEIDDLEDIEMDYQVDDEFEDYEDEEEEE